MKLRKVKTSVCPFTNSNICEMTNYISIDKLFVVFVNFLDLDDNERLCAIEPRLGSRRFASSRRGGGREYEKLCATESRLPLKRSPP